MKILSTVLIVIIGAVSLYVGLLVTSTTADSMPYENNETITNETWTVNVGTYVELNEEPIKDGSETVYNSTGSVMVKGTDYEIGYDNGTIKALSGGDLTDANTAEITYTHLYRSSTFLTIEGNVNSAFVLVGVGFIVIAAGFIIAALINRLAPGLFDMNRSSK